MTIGVGEDRHEIQQIVLEPLTDSDAVGATTGRTSGSRRRTSATSEEISKFAGGRRRSDRSRGRGSNWSCFLIRNENSSKKNEKMHFMKRLVDFVYINCMDLKLMNESTDAPHENISGIFVCSVVARARSFFSYPEKSGNQWARGCRHEFADVFIECVFVLLHPPVNFIDNVFSIVFDHEQRRLSWVDHYMMR